MSELFLEKSSAVLALLVTEEVKLKPKTVQSVIFVHKNGRFGSVFFDSDLEIPDRCLFLGGGICKPTFERIGKDSNLDVNEVSFNCDGIFDLAELRAGKDGMDVRCGMRNKDGFDLSLMNNQLYNKTSRIREKIKDKMSGTINDEIMRIIESQGK